MSITEAASAFVASTARSISLSTMFTATAAASDPAYLVLTAIDRSEYTAGASGATGSFTGNGHTGNFSSLGGDGRGAGIVFTYQASTGRYYNSTYGYFDQLTYLSSGSADDVTNLSLFATSSLTQATADASNAYTMMQAEPAGYIYIGSATVLTAPKYTATVPTQATPDSIAAVADSFVGAAWNMNGCWVLASAISAEAGASLPVQSTDIGLAGQANGEWIVAYNGPNGQSGNWQSMLTEGEIVVFGTPGGGGHITTCVSGSGSTALLVDNETLVQSNGTIQNAANDGSSNDVIIQAGHLASQEFAGVQAASVVIYELDTPVVTDAVASDRLVCLASQSLGSLFTATDPGNKTITKWQVYDIASGEDLVVGGISYQDHSAAAALTAASLGLVSLLAGSTAGSDTLDVRAFNGTYWGDWQSLLVTITASAPAAPPKLTAQTAAQTWVGGRPVTLALPANSFTDPQNQALTYTAKLSNGQALPTWLTFNAATDTFSGTPPTTSQSLSITVTATDTSNLSVTDTFLATIINAPSVTAQTANQTWTEGKAVSLALPGNTFNDPQNQALKYAATLSNGQALPSWLTFNATTDTFTGTAPTTAQSLSITVTATDTSGLSASETFAASVQPTPVQPTPVVVKPGITVSQPTASQVWTDSESLNLALPSATFTDALGLKMYFQAYQAAGPSVLSWLRFNSATDTFSGSVPTTASGTIQLEVVATDSHYVSATDLFSVTLSPAASHVSQPGSISIVQPFVPTPTAASLTLHT